MSFGEYFWHLVWRAFGPRFDRARKIHFAVGMAAEVILLAALLFFPTSSVKMFEQIRAYGWTVAFLYLVVAFLIALGRESYELHLETLAKIPDRSRADIRDKLNWLIIDTKRFSEHVDWAKAHHYRDNIGKWRERTEAGLREIGEAYAERFRAIPRLSGANHTETMKGLEAAQALLEDIKREEEARR
jgi:hypothetical protein